MRFASLGSGSRGNALVVEAEADGQCTRVLLDCGFGPRELVQRLARLGLALDDLNAIVLTHEHSDHSAGVHACARRQQIEVFLTHGTLGAMAAAGSGEIAALTTLRLIASDVAFSVGALQIQPFPVPHDAREPVQYVFTDGSHRLGVLTDAGVATPHMRGMLDGCDALVLECNHDDEMLARGAYPWPLKQRIAGPYGHLANDAAAALLATLERSRLQHLVAAHLSQQNNTPLLARGALAAAGGYREEWIVVASQEEGFSWLILE